jgi:hypothetical protein
VLGRKPRPDDRRCHAVLPLDLPAHSNINMIMAEPTAGRTAMSHDAPEV